MKTKNSRCQPPCPTEETRPLDGEIAERDLSRLTKAVGHPARIQILRLLKQSNSCICSEIVDELPLAQSTISQHLKVLKQAGLIIGEINGPSVCYCINQKELQRLQDLVATL